MKLLILIISITWSFGGGYGGSDALKGPFYKIVDSPQEAAIYIYNDRPASWDIEPDKKEYKLYSIDLKTKKIAEIQIPELEFNYKVAPTLKLDDENK